MEGMCLFTVNYTNITRRTSLKQSNISHTSHIIIIYLKGNIYTII